MFLANDFAGEKFASIEACTLDCLSVLTIGTRIYGQAQTKHHCGHGTLNATNWNPQGRLDPL